VSITIVVVLLSIKILLLNLLSFKELDLHTSHSHAIIGTPPLVPVPKKVIFKGGQNMNANYLKGTKENYLSNG
jgi:hypothetical protein